MSRRSRRTRRQARAKAKRPKRWVVDVIRPRGVPFMHRAMAMLADLDTIQRAHFRAVALACGRDTGPSTTTNYDHARAMWR